MVNKDQISFGEGEIEVPSSFEIFLRNINRLDALISVQNKHSDFHPSPEPFFYSCIVTLATYWEVFCTDLIKEATFILSHELDKHSSLPLELRKIVSKEVKNEKHELSAWKLAQNNWRGYVYSRVKNLDDNPIDLKSARPKNIEDAIKKFLGFTDFEDLWKIKNKSEEEAKEAVDEFLNKRNDIVHKGIVFNINIGDSDYLISYKYLFIELSHTFLKYFDHKLFELVGIRFYENEKLLELNKQPFNLLKDKGYT